MVRNKEKARGVEDFVDMSILRLMGQVIFIYLVISYARTLTSESMNQHTVPYRASYDDSSMYSFFLVQKAYTSILA